MRAAKADEDFAGGWIDQGAPTILVLAFTGDVESHEAAAREHWGGALCVPEFRYTYARLRQIQRELHEVGADRYGIEVLTSGTNVMENRVEIAVIVADQDALDRIEADYGEGAVEVSPRLRPVGAE